MEDYCQNCKHSHECARYVFNLSPEKVREWCNDRRKENGLTLQNVADRSGVPFGSVARFFSSDGSEYRYTTAAPIIASLIEHGNCPMQYTDWSKTPEEENKDVIRSLEFTIAMQKKIIIILGIVCILLIIQQFAALIIDYFTAGGFFWH